MYETSKLRGRIIEKFGSQKDFAKSVHSSITFVSLYLNGHTNLNQKTIDKWVTALDIDVSEIPIYFFTKEVHETEH